MTNREIHELTAREIDALVAEKVMEWEDHGKIGMAPKGILPSEEYYARYFAPQFEIPNYSTDISAAWEITKKFRLPWSIGECSDGDYECYISNNITEYAETAAKAICKAALKAVGVDIDSSK